MDKNLLEKLFCFMIIPKIAVHEISDHFSIANVKPIECLPVSLFCRSDEDKFALAFRQIHRTFHRALYLINSSVC